MSTRLFRIINKRAYGAFVFAHSEKEVLEIAKDKNIVVNKNTVIADQTDFYMEGHKSSESLKLALASDIVGTGGIQIPSYTMEQTLNPESHPDPESFWVIFDKKDFRVKPLTQKKTASFEM